MPALPARPVVMFDFDGTLADTWRDIANALNRTLADVGLEPVSGPEVRFWIGEGALRLLAQAVPEAERSEPHLDQLYERFRVHYDQCCLDTTETYPGILDCLDSLEGAALAVLSNKPARFLDRVLGGLGLKSYFRVVVAGDTLEASKPSASVVEHLLSQIDVEPTEIWMVGDSAIDVETGKRAGARTIGCGWGLRGRDELRDAGVDHLVESPREIAALVLHGA
jgi:phosphoglycolate phosphatase